MSDDLVVIGSWSDEAGRSLRLQQFAADGESFIPLFSDEEAFRQQVKGSGFERDGIAIDRGLLAATLHGDELLILDPGGPAPVRLRKRDLLADGSGG